MTNPNHPELVFAKQAGIKASRADDLIAHIIKEHGLKLIAVAGTHGKSTTTAMIIWLFKQLGVPISYSFGGKLEFGASGEFDKASQYFVLEADEFDRKFLSFYPELTLVSGLDYDHPDIYPTRQSYLQAFSEFIGQSKHTVLWLDDAEQLGLAADGSNALLDASDPRIDHELTLAGHVNRKNAWLVMEAFLEFLGFRDQADLLAIMNKFPGLSRRFEQIAPNIYSDYAHTPPKIRGALQMAREVAGDNVVVVYEGLHNLRQHFIKDQLKDLFNDVKDLYIVPSYLARENKDLELLTPDKLLDLLSNKTKAHAEAAALDGELAQKIKTQAKTGALVLCLSAGGAGSLDEWLRATFS